MTHDLEVYKGSLVEKDYVILENIYTGSEMDQLTRLIDSADGSGPSFRKQKDLFAIRRFLEVIPGVAELLLNERLRVLVQELSGGNSRLVKSIYFDKPEHSNWFVAWHQDLTISVDKKLELKGYGPWTVKQEQFAVQPPVELLEKICTIRVHLDDTTEANGALKVIPGSHRHGVCRPNKMDLDSKSEETCSVKSGGIMIMRPLLLHRSARSTAAAGRRVIQMEFCAEKLPGGLNWSEFFEF